VANPTAQFRGRWWYAFGGVGGVSLRHDKGVTIVLQGTSVGVEFAANLNKIKISLK